MNNLGNWFYNPELINQQAYLAQQEYIRAYENKQQVDVAQASKAFADFLDKADKVDVNHQQQLFLACFGLLAKKLKW